MAIIRNFDPNQLSITIGTRALTGFAPDKMLTISLNEEVTKAYVDIHGNTTFVRNNNRNATASLFFSQWSPSNGDLSTFYNLDINTDNGIFPFMAKDSKNDTLISSAGVKIIGVPEFSGGSEVAIYEWKLLLTNTGMFIGGLNN